MLIGRWIPGNLGTLTRYTKRWIESSGLVIGSVPFNFENYVQRHMLL
jgi:hypothetical protein